MFEVKVINSTALLAPLPIAQANKRILVLAPHPDDFDAIAVTLKAFHNQGSLIGLKVLCPAWSGVEAEFVNSNDPALKAAARQLEQRNSCRLFGLADDQVEFLNLSENAQGELLNETHNVLLLRKALEKFKPDYIFMPHWNDTNSDHRLAFEMLKSFAADSGITCFLNQDPKTIALRADLVTLFDSETAAWKAQLLRCHASQHQRNLRTRNIGFDERILATNRQYAKDFKAEYAEVFEVITL